MTDPIRAALERLIELDSNSITMRSKACCKAWTEAVIRARTALAAQPASPAEGEVAELVAQLGADAECVKAEHYGPCNMTADQMRRAAELLAQRHPAPVPVSERPWERDGWCDELGRCWLLLCPDDGFHLPNWKLDRPSHHELPNGAVSLPAHALPLPTEDRT